MAMLSLHLKTHNQQINFSLSFGKNLANLIAVPSRTSIYWLQSSLQVGDMRYQIATDILYVLNDNNNNSYFLSRTYPACGCPRRLKKYIHLVIGTLEEISLKLRIKFLKNVTCSY